MGFCLLLAAARRLVQGDRYARSPAFTRYDPGYMLGREIHGQTLGIIGLGRIGKQVARRARGFDMTVLYHNRRRDPAAEAALGVRYATFDELLAQSDFVMLCCPLTGETTGLINAAALARMKPTAILINVARGPVVDTAALTSALRDKQIYAAALDVTDPEPLPRDHPLRSKPGRRWPKSRSRICCGAWLGSDYCTRCLRATEVDASEFPISTRAVQRRDAN
jgi:glyoxylate reductase